MQRFNDKVVVVLGGNSGIGFATAKAFADEGAWVAITGRDSRTLATAASDIGPRATPYRSDIADLQQIKDLFARIGTEYGRIDVLFISSGVLILTPIETCTEADWDALHKVNLKGTFFSVQHALPLMPAKSSIVLTGSVATRKGEPTVSIYAASKAGLRALGRSLACELAVRGIRVNVVSPGAIDTPIFDRIGGVPAEAVPSLRQMVIDHAVMKRMGKPAEVASAVLFLASEDASFITGIDLVVDNGSSSFVNASRRTLHD